MSQTSAPAAGALGTRRKRLFLHIGTHKTGTTSIQWLAARADGELARNGILYPRAGRPAPEAIADGHHLFAWSLSKHVTTAPFWPEEIIDHLSVWNSLHAEVDASDCERVLISSEEFDTLNAAQIADLAARLAIYDVTIVCFLRRIDIFVQAMYATDVMYSCDLRGIDQYMREMRTPTDYDALIAPWRENFGREAAVVLPYLSDARPQWSVTGDFFSLLGLDSQILERATTTIAQPQNVSVPWYVVQTMRSFRALGLPEQVALDFLGAMLATKPKGRVGHDILPPSARRRLVESNQAALAAALSRPIPHDLAAWFAGADIPANDEAWDRAHKYDYAAVCEAIYRLRAHIEASASETPKP